MFQEDRLCEALTPVENVALVCPRKPCAPELSALLACVLPEECLNRPVRELSGGMRRRVALVRACAHPGSAVVLDEPFTGLDAQTKRVVTAFLMRERAGRTLVVSTHSDEDVALLGAERVMLADIASFDEARLAAIMARAAEEENEENEKKGSVSMFDSTKTMKEIATEDPLFADFLVSKGFPFTVENPMTELVTFDDVVERRGLDKEAFLTEYAAWREARGE